MTRIRAPALIGLSFIAGAAIQLAFAARHPIAAQLAALAVAVAIGLLIVRLRRPKFAKADDPARAWEAHCEEHEREMRGSAVMTAPGLRAGYASARVTAGSFRPWGSAPNVEASAETVAHMWDDEDDFDGE